MKNEKTFLQTRKTTPHPKEAKQWAPLPTTNHPHKTAKEKDHQNASLISTV